MNIDDKIESLGGMRKVRPATWRAPTADDVAQIERAVGAPLPDDYRGFLTKRSVTAFAQPYAIARLQEPAPFGQEVTLNVFFGFSTDGKYSIANEIETYQGRMPPGLLPIADDPGGNIICLAVGGSDAGAVYLWDHEHANLPEGRVMEYFKDLDQRGVDTSSMQPHDAIREWELIHRAELPKPPGYGNLYRLASSFKDFIGTLRHQPA